MTKIPDFDSQEVQSQLFSRTVAGYFNTGTIGPLPAFAHQAMMRAVNAELGDLRTTFEGFLSFLDFAASLRARLGRVVGADASEIALTHGTTEGINIALWGLGWKRGDSVVTTNVEHGSVLIPLYQLHQRYDLNIHFVDAASGDPDRILAAMAPAIRPGVQLVIVPHIPKETGAILPVREITELAHHAGALVLVDAAQAVGAIPVDLHTLGVDYYAFSGHKWLCGPVGTGGLYVSSSAMHMLRPTYVADGNPYMRDDPGTLELGEKANRYEVGGYSRSALHGLAASVTWLSEEFGFDIIYRRIQEIREYFVDRISRIPEVELMAPPSRLAGIVSFRISGVESKECIEYLSGRDVFFSLLPDISAIRVSCGFFNTPEQVDRAIELIGEIIPRKPRSRY
jgi:L-cysteine/cystine lyase